MKTTPLVDIIYNALLHFEHQQCPHCQKFIGLQEHVKGEDIDKWLEKELLNAF